MVEEENRQMIIMNDRPQGGSAYDQGRVEVMINRRGYSDDNLGMAESLNEKDANGNGLNVSVKFYQAFTTSRDQALTTIRKSYLYHYSLPQVLYTSNFTINSTQYHHRLSSPRDFLRQLIDLYLIYDIHFSLQTSERL